jgi:hypothetical protein
MNREEKIMKRLQEHYDEALEYFPENRIVGIFLQGSQNYGLDYEGSDIDTKLIVVPSLEDIVLNKKPVSTTHVRANDEHIDFKDVRLYIETFYKQNLNFLEILFTPYFCINPLYANQWNRLLDNREKIARMNEARAVKSMKGIALEKYHAMKHPYPSKLDLIEKYGMDGKQVSHLIRVDDFLTRYINGEPYCNCLHPSPDKVDEILAYKKQQIPLAEAEVRAEEVLKHAVEISDKFCEQTPMQEDPEMRELLEDASYHIMKIAVEHELAK